MVYGTRNVSIDVQQFPAAHFWLAKAGPQFWAKPAAAKHAAMKIEYRIVEDSKLGSEREGLKQSKWIIKS